MKTKNFSFQAIIAIALIFASCQKEPSNLDTSSVSSSDAENLSVARVKVFARGLHNPRGLKFGPDGYLYVAEAGRGGTKSTVGICEQIPQSGGGPFLGSPVGGRISKISPAGEQTVVLHSLPSSNGQPEAGSPVLGVADVEFMGGKLYALLAGAGCSHGVQSVDNGVVRINDDGSWRLIANTSAFQIAHPVKNPDEDDFGQDGNPYSMIKVDSNFYVIEPNHGEMLKITHDGYISRVIDISASEGHIVPTVIDYYDGNFYVGNLNVFPIVKGSSNIYKITPDGKITVWAGGFTTILGIVFDKQGRLYVLENTTGNNQFPTPGTGKIIRLDRSKSTDKRETIAEGLNLPTGITMGHDRKLYVSNWGFGPNAIGGGQVLQIDVND